MQTAAGCASPLGALAAAGRRRDAGRLGPFVARSGRRVQLAAPAPDMARPQVLVLGVGQ